jgi:DNA polymerase III epsilon subunit-like protein
MKDGDRWVVVDTETDGFHDPVHVIEIAAQVMVGWRPEGPPFRVLINHEIHMDWQAHDVHGYSAEFLRENGVTPFEAHQRFAEYVGRYPIVSHNLAFDWDRALLAEWRRLGIPTIGRRGFCSLMLSRRIIPEVPGHGLDVLKHAFSLESSVSHKAHNDVATLVELLRTVIAPRLQKLSLDTYDMVEAFSALEAKKAREVVKSTFGSDFVSRGSKLKNKTETITPGSVYHVARQGIIIGQYLLLGLYNGMRSGELNGDDHYWTNGMGESWAKLSDIIALINSVAPKMASPQQIAYLTWLGILNADSYTDKEASDKIQKIGGNITPRDDGKNWTIERFILYPDLFRDELQKYLASKVRRACLAHYDVTVFGSTKYPDADVCAEVFKHLAQVNVNWWAEDDCSEAFYAVLKSLHPACCDGKSFFYEHELPKVLHQYVRMLLVGCSEKLTKAKIRDVMLLLSNEDDGWFKKEGYEEVFLRKLKLKYPGCCDGGDRFEIAQVQAAAEVAELEARIREKTSMESFPDGMLINEKVELGLLYKRLARLTESPETIRQSFDWLVNAAGSGSMEAAREMVNFSPEMYGYKPPLVELRTWMRFVIAYDKDRFGFSGLEQLGTPQSSLILSMSDGFFSHLLSTVEALMSSDELGESDVKFRILSERLDDFNDARRPS